MVIIIQVYYVHLKLNKSIYELYIILIEIHGTQGVIRLSVIVKYKNNKLLMLYKGTSVIIPTN
jgi:hypothetical protein